MMRLEVVTTMTSRSVLSLLVLPGALLLLGLPKMADAQSCSGANLIDETLPTGSRWELCWQHRDEEGIALTGVHFTTPGGVRRQVMKEASVAQIHVAYATGGTPLNLVTDVASGAGLGGGNLFDMAPGDCPGGTLRSHAGNSVVCIATLRRGYAYKSYGNQLQGYLLSVSSISSVGAHTYIVKWKFYDDGTIEPSIGLSGRIPAITSDTRYGWLLDDAGRVAVAFTSHYTWRLDFDIGADATNDIVEEFEVIPSADRRRKTLSVSEIGSEQIRSVNPDLKRTWRIRDSSTVNADGRFISYHLDPLHTGHRYQPAPGDEWASGDVAFTVWNACERFPNENPTAGGCGGNLNAFVNGEAMTPADIVIWYSTSYHHVPRSEDEPAVPVHWDGVTIVPRDWTATNPLTDARPATRPQFWSVQGMELGQS